MFAVLAIALWCTVSITAAQDCQHYSQQGESQVIYERFFKEPEPLRNGFFLEIGGLDGVTFSNTLFFERCLGWTGVLIEANPANFNKLRHNRKNTHNLHMAACRHEQMISFTVDGGAIAGSLQHMPDTFMKQWHGTLHPRAVPVYCGNLAHQLCVLGITKIDFASIDVEGAELEVIRSLNFTTVDVSVVIVEADTHNLEKNDAVRTLMIAAGFEYLPGVVTNSDLFVNKQHAGSAQRAAMPCSMPTGPTAVAAPPSSAFDDDNYDFDDDPAKLERAIASEWKKCADEPGYCAVTVPQIVRYGLDVDDTYIERLVEPPGIHCDLPSFGHDPAVHRHKICSKATVPSAAAGTLPSDDQSSPPPSTTLLEVRLLKILSSQLAAPKLHPIWIVQQSSASALPWRAYNWPWSVIDSNMRPLDFGKKTIAFSGVIPGGNQSLSFSKEPSYHEHYSRCLYAFTMKKAGWDCMRHYEILADGAVPYFIGLEKMPQNTMSLFPRNLILALMHLPGVNVRTEMRDRKQQSYVAYDVAEASLALSDFPVRTYELLAHKLREYVHRYLTSSAVAREVLRVTGNERARSVLIVRNLTVASGNLLDYMEMFAVLGMKYLLGARAVEYPPLDCLYDDYDRAKNPGWGGGFSYARRLPSSWRPPLQLHNYTDVAAAIARHEFDVIVYGEQAHCNAAPHCIFADEIAAAQYDPRAVWLIRGSDTTLPLDGAYPPSVVTNDALGRDFSTRGHPVFYREI